MLANFFALIRLILRAFQLWDAFLDSVDQADIAAREVRRQKREQAVDDAAKAKTPEDAYDAQERIVDSQPKP